MRRGCWAGRRAGRAGSTRTGPTGSQQTGLGLDTGTVSETVVIRYLYLFLQLTDNFLTLSDLRDARGFKKDQIQEFREQKWTYRKKSVSGSTIQKIGF